MSEQKPKVVPAEPKPKDPDTSKELSDDALDRVSGGMASLGNAIPGVSGATGLPARETGTCITQLG